MLGFRAKGTTTVINCIDEELVEARWFTRDEVRDGGDERYVAACPVFHLPLAHRRLAG